MEFSPRSESKMDAEKEYSSRIVLSFFRHSEKEKTPPEGKTGDEEILLTEKGRKLAIDQGDVFRLPEDGIAQSVAFGSPRKRAQETAMFVMAGGEDTITGQESIGELKEKINEEVAHGSKISTDKRLDFSTGGSEFEKAFMQAYLSKDTSFMEWLVNESDTLAIAAHDKEASSYSRSAGNVAGIVSKYLGIAKRFDEIVDKKHDQYSDTLQRFFGSHQSIPESFLAKVIEKTQGVEGRNVFLKSISDKGFGFVEGFQMEMRNKDGEQDPELIMHFNKKDAQGNTAYEFHKTIDPLVIREIIEEGKKLDQETQSQ